MRRLVTFTDFIRHIVLLVLLVTILLVLIVGIPVFYLYSQGQLVLPISLEAIVSNPGLLLVLFQDLMRNDFFLTLFKISVFPGFTFVALFAAVIILWERKFLAKMQLRVGPFYAGKFEGILQPIADVLKLLFKELLIPAQVDKLFFWAVPTVAIAIATASIAVIPVSEYWVIARSSVGLLVIFAIIGFFPIIAILGGWASNSKYPLIGGLRALHQMIAYEIPLLLSTLGVVILGGSLDLISIVKAQSNMWYIFPSIVGAFVFFCSALAELERLPLDMPEAESEIVTGWLTEYSGMNYGLIYGIAAYLKFYTMAGLFTTLFLGGWLGPTFLPPEVWFIVKIFVVGTIFIIPRGVYPRIRIDLLLRKGWVNLLLLSLLNIFIAIFLVQLEVVKPGGLL